MTRKRSAAGMPLRDPAHRSQTGPVEDMRFFTTVEVAEFVGVSARTVRRWIEHKTLVAHHFGVAVRIGESDLTVCLPKIISGRNGGAARTRSEWPRWHRFAGPPDPGARLNSETRFNRQTRACTSREPNLWRLGV